MRILTRSYILAGLLYGLMILGAPGASAAPIKSNRFIGIRLTLLPPYTIIKNHLISMWELYKSQMIAAAVVMTVLLILVVVLINVTRRLNTAHRALSRLNENLETQVRERILALRQTNQTLELEIAERSRVEAALRESEARTATILRLSPVVIGVSTVAEGCYTDVNDAFERVLGYSQAETIGRTSFDLNLWVDEDTRSNILREIQTHGRIENQEIRLRRKSGEIFPALLFITPIDLHNTPCLLAMMMDITDRKRTEEELRETRDALQTIFYSSPLAILTLDAEDRVMMWNTAAEAMFGWSDKQVLGQVDPTVPESKSNEYHALRQVTLDGMAFSNLDTMRKKKNGEQFHVSLSVAPLRGQQGQVIGRMHVVTDITERKKFQEELHQLAMTDELTKISNRRHFMDLAQSEVKRAVRLKHPPAIALIDIDYFKQINDTHGHAAGDQALVEFTKICLKQIREIDVFARFGGDEFVLLLPETNQEQAYVVVERICRALASQAIDLDGKPALLTISSGIASLSGNQQSIDTLLSQADEALYCAKEAGRNNIIRYDKLCDKAKKIADRPN